MSYTGIDTFAVHAPRIAAQLDKAQLSRLIAAIDGTQHAFALPLYRAALADELRLVLALPGGRIPPKVLDRACPATVVVLSGDQWDRPREIPAPDRFPQARRALAWAGGYILHATGGQEMHYRAAVAMAGAFRRLVLIETATAQEDAWAALVTDEVARRPESRPLRGFGISARPRGGFHPALGDMA